MVICDCGGRDADAEVVESRNADNSGMSRSDGSARKSWRMDEGNETRSLLWLFEP